MTKKRINKAKYLRYCQYCGAAFKTTRPHTKFCCASHRAAHSKGRRMELVDYRRTEMYNKIESMFYEVGKTSEVAEIDELRRLLRERFYDLADKVLIAVRIGDLKTIEEINAKLDKALIKIDKLDE